MSASTSQDEIPPPPSPPPSSQIPTQQTPHTKGFTKVIDVPKSSKSFKIHGAGVSTEDANQKFLRSLPSAWSQVSLIMRTKPGVDSLSFDDLYNNLRVFESDIKGSTASSSSSPQNIAFCLMRTPAVLMKLVPLIMFPIFLVKTQSMKNLHHTHFCKSIKIPQLDSEDLNRLDEYDLEEILEVASGHDLNENEKVLQEDWRRDAWNSRNKDGSRTGQKEDSKALVTVNERRSGLANLQR
ncbi:hypothetical protein Tco_1317356 [Tanacetum coccineum]